MMVPAEDYPENRQGPFLQGIVNQRNPSTEGHNFIGQTVEETPVSASCLPIKYFAVAGKKVCGVDFLLVVEDPSKITKISC